MAETFPINLLALLNERERERERECGRVRKFVFAQQKMKKK
jgi:hypothetical protein